MNATSLIIVFVSFLVTTNMYAQNSNVIFSNHNEETFTKEYIVYDTVESMALSKIVYQYDENGNRISKTSYIWNDNKGWIGSQLYIYEYAGDQLSTIAFTKWDKQSNKWSDQAENIPYINDKDRLLAEEQIK